MVAAKTVQRLGLAASCGALAVGGVLIVPKWRERPPVAAPVTELAEDAGIEEWCASGLAAVRGGGCFAAPSKGRRPSTLVVYVHGRYSPKTLDDELARQARVSRLGTAMGFGVLAMRGVQGECKAQELADTWCWPSSPVNAEDGAAFVKRFEPAIAAAKAELGGGPTVLLGFSNGAYFATLIATRGLAPFDAIAIAHGGPVPPTRATRTAPPLLLLTADDDPSDGEMRQLDAELTRERWPHELVSREGGHALPESDVKLALTFFDRALREPLPLSPPLQPPRSRRETGEMDADRAAIPSVGADAPENSPNDSEIPDDDSGS